MNEQYLFRGKRVDNGEWVEGWYCMNSFGKWPLKDAIIPEQQAVDGCFTFVAVDPATVGQCTGLRDRMGKLIWKGDIVKYSVYGCLDCRYCDYEYTNECDPEIKIGVVDTCKTNMTNMIYDAHHELIASLYHNSAACSNVIGNIHDTPELLEEV